MVAASDRSAWSTVEATLLSQSSGIDCRWDRPRLGRPTILNRRTVERILTTERVTVEATHCSTRLLARYTSVAP